MKSSFKIGDKVAVLDDSIIGIVQKVEKQTITILTQDDFLMNFDTQELVLQQKDEIIDFLTNSKIPVKDDNKTVKKSKKRVVNTVIEVDLHIHHLTKSTKGLSNYDMLQLQLQTAKQALLKARKQKQQRIVFIHGVGQGVLKRELYELLKSYHVEIYDASLQKYGSGATEVYIYQN